MESQLAFLSRLPFPDFERDYEFVALRHDRDYPFSEGRLASSAGLDLAAADYEEVFEEHQRPHSTALHSRIRGRGAYLCGPLSRFNLNFERLRPRARRAAQLAGLSPPVKNPYKSLLVRGVEIVQCLDEAIAIISGYQPPEPACVPVHLAAGTGAAFTEAPRGTLYHRYVVDEQGLLTDAKIVPPTSQNQTTIEGDLFELAPALVKLAHGEATRRAELAVRNYDPCISCSTHFIELTLEQEP
jgi:coenzyme F420-reducing hydrogenase alpha subunit